MVCGTLYIISFNLHHHSKGGHQDLQKEAQRQRSSHFTINETQGLKSQTSGFRAKVSPITWFRCDIVWWGWQEALPDLGLWGGPYFGEQGLTSGCPGGSVKLWLVPGSCSICFAPARRVLASNKEAKAKFWLGAPFTSKMERIHGRTWAWMSQFECQEFSKKICTGLT